MDSLALFLQLTTTCAGFCAADRALTTCRVQKPYYLLHSVHNAWVVWLTATDVWTSFTDIHNLDRYGINYEAVATVVALHLYHLLIYWRQFLLDDWLHHIGMIGVAIPIGLAIPSSTLMGFSLFFATGLPGGINYFMLFLQRNGCLNRMTEKGWNRVLHTWIRAPGCLAHAALTAAVVLSSEGSESQWMRAVALVPAALMFWNGQYFMGQVVSNYARLTVRPTDGHEHVV